MTGIAYAAGPAAGMGGFASFLPLILIFVVFYFLLIRPQQKQAKQHRQFLSDLKTGNKVVTKGGVYGTITGLSDSVVTLEIAQDVRIKVTRDAIGGSAVADAAGVPAKKEGKKG
jgi:preprotein translocase subunit YajC